MKAQLFYSFLLFTALSSLVTRSFSDDKYGVVQQNLGEIITIIIKLQKVSMCAEYLCVKSQFSMDMLIGIHSWKKNMPPEVEDV